MVVVTVVEGPATGVVVVVVVVVAVPYVVGPTAVADGTGVMVGKGSVSRRDGALRPLSIRGGLDGDQSVQGKGRKVEHSAEVAFDVLLFEGSRFQSGKKLQAKCSMAGLHDSGLKNRSVPDHQWAFDLSNPGRRSPWRHILRIRANCIGSVKYAKA